MRRLGCRIHPELTQPQVRLLRAATGGAWATRTSLATAVSLRDLGYVELVPVVSATRRRLAAFITGEGRKALKKQPTNAKETP